MLVDDSVDADLDMFLGGIGGGPDGGMGGVDGGGGA